MAGGGGPDPEPDPGRLSFSPRAANPGPAGAAAQRGRRQAEPPARAGAAPQRPRHQPRQLRQLQGGRRPAVLRPLPRRLPPAVLVRPSPGPRCPLTPTWRVFVLSAILPAPGQGGAHPPSRTCSSRGRRRGGSTRPFCPVRAGRAGLRRRAQRQQGDVRGRGAVWTPRSLPVLRFVAVRMSHVGLGSFCAGLASRVCVRWG